jgi:hypothetical protein
LGRALCARAGANTAAAASKAADTFMVMVRELTAVNPYLRDNVGLRNVSSRKGVGSVGEGKKRREKQRRSHDPS